MPEFILDTGDRASSERYKALDAFTQGYIEAMFFTESSPAYNSEEWHTPECQDALSEGQADGSIPGDTSFADLSQTALVTIVAECQLFQATNAALLDQVGRSCSHSARRSAQGGRGYLGQVELARYVQSTQSVY